MPPPVIIETPDGLVDGFNTDYRTSTAYAPGSVEVFVDGQALVRDNSYDGWIELGGAWLRMNRAPRVGSVVQVFFRPLYA